MVPASVSMWAASDSSAQRVHEHADDHLEGHESEQQRERDAVSVRGHGVRVPRVAVAAMVLTMVGAAVALAVVVVRARHHNYRPGGQSVMRTASVRARRPVLGLRGPRHCGDVGGAASA
jgi:hypothetical protein